MNTERISKLKKAVKEKTDVVSNSIVEYKTLNDKLNSSLEVSLSIIIDLSKILKHYHDLLNAIEEFVDEPIDMAEDVKSLAATAFDRMTASFNKHIDDIIESYDDESQYAKNLIDLREKINESFKKENSSSKADDGVEEEGDEKDDGVDKESVKKQKKDKGIKFTS